MVTLIKTTRKCDTQHNNTLCRVLLACVVKSRFVPVSSSLFPSSHNATDPQPNSLASFMHDRVTKAVEIHSGNLYKIWHGNVLRMTMLHHFFSVSKRWNISFVLHQLCNLLMQDSRNLTAILSHSFHTYDNGTARFMNSQLYRWYHKKGRHISMPNFIKFIEVSTYTLSFSSQLLNAFTIF